MKVNYFFEASIFSITIIIAISLFLYFLYIIHNYITRKHFIYLVKNGLNQHNINYDDLINLKNKKKLNSINFNIAISELKAEIDFTNNKTLSIHKDKFNELIELHSKNNPFSDLPNNIKNSLQIMFSNNQYNKAEIKKLAHQLSYHIKKQTKKDKIMFIINIVSLLLGIFGLFWGFIK